MESVYFSGIQNEIIASVTEAKVQLRIAVAWFTNDRIFEMLLVKLGEGVKITLVIIDDYINNGDYGLNFQKFIDEGGTLFYGKEDNPMHHKFCIIDDTILLTGSYNWTYFAEYKNHENMVKFEFNQTIINPYIIEFNKLIEHLSLVTVANKILIGELEAKDIFSIKNYLTMDILYNAKQNSNIELLEAAKNISPDNKTVLQEYRSIKHLQIVENSIVINSIKETTMLPEVRNTLKSSIGIKCRLEGIDGKFSTIVSKGENIPCKMSHVYHTVSDNQVQMSIETFKGENDMAEKNIRLGKFLISDLPKSMFWNIK